ncbi:glycosyltransferase family 4 protein [Vibrio cholerae]|uniref:glycosyltransferase family 4 protein n=1 Tax=Vibrio cholerae TaxID=666 RepID=UPI00163BC7A5|nr:glycosyltransferase family 4 protein [Vibrio cholerae]
MQRIYVFSNAISRKNGGSSSILDLSNCISQLGHAVEIRSVLGILDKLIYKASNIDRNISIGFMKPSVLNGKNISKPKRILNRIFSFNSQDEIVEHSIILDSFGLPENIKKDLKSKNCNIILNHAGSVTAFSQYFMDYESSDEKNVLEAYLEYIKSYDYVLFQSESQANELDNLLATSDTRTVLVRPSVSEKDINLCLEKDKIVLDRSKFNITVVGSVQKRKGQDLLIEIANILSNEPVDFVINVVGNVLEHDFYESIKRLVADNDLSDRVIFHGFQSDYLTYMNNSDIILQVSKEEGVSRILREAMALAKPIVSFRLDGTADLLSEDVDCLLAEPGSVKDISDKLVALIRSPELSISLGRNAKLNFDEKYGYRQYSKQVSELLSLLSA